MTTPVAIGPEIKDFSEAHTPIQFKIDDDVFECYPVIPVGTMLMFASKGQSVGDDPSPETQMAVYEEMLRLVMQPESADLFIERMNSREKPVSTRQAQEVISWIMEQHGERPTEPSENSSDGSPSPADGTNMTADGPSGA